MDSIIQQSALPFRLLCLDGGGAKGFYTLGVLLELEGMLGKPIHESFDLVYGTSTGSIIAAMIAQGTSIDDIHQHYKKHVPSIMQANSPSKKSSILSNLANEILGDAKFDSVKVDIGIVTTKWVIERPMIFKSNIQQAFGRKGTFVPGFGVPIREAVEASCSAYPFFNNKIVHTASGDDIELIDGGYCANNPTLYAIADATNAMSVARERIRVLSIGVGTYPAPKLPFFSKMRWFNYLKSVQLLQKTLEINTQSMDQLRINLFKDIPTVRISETFEKPEMATDLFEHDLSKLNLIRQRGKESFAKVENEIKSLLEI